MTARAREPSAGADAWFSDALSGPDGMADSAPTMPVLDVYPDALGTPMPDVQPRFVQRVPPPTGSPVAAAFSVDVRPIEPEVSRRAPRQPDGAGATPRAVTGAKRAPVQRQAQGRQPAQPRPAVAPRGVGQQPPASPLRGHRNQASPPHQYIPTQAPASGRSSATPAAVQPAPPSPGPGAASMQRIRDQARRTGVRNRTSGNAVAVLVFIAIVVFASGLGGRIIELLTELFQR